MIFSTFDGSIRGYVVDNQPLTSAPDAEPVAEKPKNETLPEYSAPKATPLADNSIVSVQRSTINMILTALIFLVIGVIVGMIIYDRSMNNEDQIRRIVSVALEASRAETEAMIAAALGGSGGTETARLGDDPSARYTLSPEGPALGAENAPITIVAFEDFQCGYCKRFSDETLPQILAAYPDQVRFIHRDFPILGQASLNAAHAAQCANAQGRFWDFHERFYGNQQSLTPENFTAYATETEMDVAAFTTCYEAEEFQSAIFTDLAEGQTLGITGTPTFFINGRVVIGAQPFAVFASVIEQELAALGS